jgi:hypothetical protein
MTWLGKRSFRGQSGRVYLFDLYDVSTTWGPVPAVYIAACIPKSPKSDELCKVIYVGQTNNLKLAFWSWRFQRFLDLDANRICVLVEKDEAMRLEIERDLLLSLKSVLPIR